MAAAIASSIPSLDYSQASSNVSNVKLIPTERKLGRIIFKVFDVP